VKTLLFNNKESTYMLKRQSQLEGRKLSPQYVSYIQICFVLFLISTFITDALKNIFFCYECSETNILEYIN